MDAVTARPPSARRRRKAPDDQSEACADAETDAQGADAPAADQTADRQTEAQAADAQAGSPAEGQGDTEARSAAQTATDDSEAGAQSATDAPGAGAGSATAAGEPQAAPPQAPELPSWPPPNPESGWASPGSWPDSESGSPPGSWPPDSASPPGWQPDSGSGLGSGADPEGWLGLAPGWNSGRLGDRTRVVLVIRAEDLNPPSGSPGPLPGPTTRPEDLMSTWSTANGPGTGLLAHTTMLRELCDTTVQRLIVGPDSQPLDIGRVTRTIPAQLRTALHVRDRGCVFAGCDRPPGWTEAHHLTPWATGGDTAIHNLALLCSRHHHLIHTGTWTIQMGADGHPHVTKVHTYPKRR